MNYSKIKQSDLIYLIKSQGINQYRFQEKTIKEIECMDRNYFIYTEQSNPTYFKTLLQAVKGYKKIFK